MGPAVADRVCKAAGCGTCSKSSEDGGAGCGGGHESGDRQQHKLVAAGSSASSSPFIATYTGACVAVVHLTLYACTFLHLCRVLNGLCAEPDAYLRHLTFPGFPCGHRTAAQLQFLLLRPHRVCWAFVQQLRTGPAELYSVSIALGNVLFSLCLLRRKLRHSAALRRFFCEAPFFAHHLVPLAALLWRGSAHGRGLPAMLAFHVPQRPLYIAYISFGVSAACVAAPLYVWHAHPGRPAPLKSCAERHACTPCKPLQRPQATTPPPLPPPFRPVRAAGTLHHPAHGRGRRPLQHRLHHVASELARPPAAAALPSCGRAAPGGPDDSLHPTAPASAHMQM